MSTAGLVFTNIHDAAIPPLTKIRTIASVPYGCRYRLIDFVLSNMVNADITVIGLITHNNYQSLLDHIGSGKDWDLARRTGGIKILPPFITAYDSVAANKVYSSRLEALMGVMNFIKHRTEEYIVLSDSDSVCNINLSDVLREHSESGADVTIVTKEIPSDAGYISQHEEIVRFDDSGKIYDFVKFSPTECKNQKKININTNIMVMKTEYLQNVLQEAILRGHTSFYQDVVLRRLHSDNYRAYRYEGVYALISSIESYYKANMMLLRKDVRDEIFDVPECPVYTKVRNSPPTKYVDNCDVKNSLIADGCIIGGTVENSVLFRGVTVSPGAVVKNSIVFQGTTIGECSELSCVITDKDVVIKNQRKLSGHSHLPFFVGKGEVL